MENPSNTSDTPPPTTRSGRARREPRDGLFQNFGELSKARLNALVLGTTAVGFALAPTDQPALVLFWTLVGTGLVAASASMLNQLAEMDRDGRMLRTEHWPLPAGLVSRRSVFIVGVLIAYAGVVILGLMVNLLASGLALANLLIYVLIYTPLKPRTTLNTLVGAICGSIPPMIGWAAVRGEVDGGAWVLAGILFVWQIPHFLALAWMYRDDYAKGGFQMLPAVDPEGILTARVTLIGSLALVPVSLSAFLAGFAGPIYAVVALVCGLLMVTRSVRMLAEPTRDNARNVFLASLLHLPLTLGALATGW